MPPTLQHEIGKKRPFDAPEEEAFLNLARTYSLLASDFDSLFRKHDLSEAIYNVLRILRGAGPDGRACGQIAQQTITRVPDITRLVDRLEAQGLVARARTPDDRRVVVVKITRKGLDLLSKLDKPTAALHARQLGHLARPELAELSRLLVKARTPPNEP